jgi:methyltransferase family protein
MEREHRASPQGANMPKLSRIWASILFRISGKYRLARKVERLEQRLQETKNELAAVRAKYKQEIASLRSNYYLTGEAKKLDLRQLEGFADVARQVISEQTTGMNFDRLYTIWQALQAAPADLPIIEVGTYRGGSAKFICEAQRYAGRSSPFYVCDTFAGHPRVDAALDHDRHLRPNFIQTSAELVAEYLTDYPEREIVVGDIIETSNRLPDGPYGFIHIDLDVYPATDFCVRFFAPRLGSGAVMVIDDYGFVTCPGVKKAVDDFIAANPRFRLFHLITGQALLFEAARVPSQLWTFQKAFAPPRIGAQQGEPISLRRGAA